MNKGHLVFVILSLNLALVLAGDVCQNQPDGQRLAHTTDCTKFVVCRNGLIDRIVTCPLGLHFNRFDIICDVKERAGCETTIVNQQQDTVVSSSDIPSPGLSAAAEIIDGSAGPATGPSGTTCVNSGKCVGQPDGTMFANPNTTGYIVCQCECQIEMPCAPGTQFKESLNTCTSVYVDGGNHAGSVGPSTGPSGTTCVESGKCVGQPDGTMFANPNSSGYIVCQCQCQIEMPCAPGTKFNATQNTCIHIDAGNGSGNGTGSGNAGTCDLTCSNPGKCLKQPDGAMFANANTTGYIVCQCGCPVAMPCAPGTKFNETLNTCTHIDSGNGSGSGTGNGCNLTCSNPGKCLQKPDGTMFANANTTGYIVCQCGCPIAMPCAPGTKFSETMNTCVHLDSGNGNGSGNGTGNGTDTGNGNGNGTGNGTDTGNGNGNGTGNGTDTGNGNGNGTGGFTCSAPNICTGLPDGTLFADPNSNGFILCEYQCPLQGICEPNTVFNETTKSCVDVNGSGTGSGDSGSGSGTGSTGGSNTGLTCIAPNVCTGKANGTIFANPKTTGFILCEYQCPLQGICNPLTVFNETSKSCISITGGDSGSGTGNGDSGSGTGTGGLLCSTPNACTGKPDGTILADPKTTGFIVCAHQCPLQGICYPSTVFNDTTQSCVNINAGDSGSGTGSTGGNGDSGSGSGTGTGSTGGNGDSGSGSGTGTGGDSGTGSTGGNSDSGSSSGTGDSTGGGLLCSAPNACTGKPDGTILADPTTTGFIVCAHQCPLQGICYPSTVFDLATKSCISANGGDSGSGTGSTGSGTGLCSAPNVCTGKPDGTIFANTNTTGFILCVYQCPLQGICEPSTVFNEATKSCISVNGGDSGSGTGSTGGNGDSGSSPGTGGSTGGGLLCSAPNACTGKPDGTIFADPKTTGFIVCAHQCPLQGICEPSTTFNLATKSCISINGGDSGSGTGSTGGNGDSGSGSGTGGSTGGGLLCSAPNECTGKPDGAIFADPKTTGFILCVHQCPLQGICEPSTTFNLATKSCISINGGDSGSGTGSTNGNGDSGSGSGTGGSTGGSNSGLLCSAPNACTGQPDGTIFADPKNTGFIVCAHQCPLQGICEPSTVFNQVTKSCISINGGDSGSGTGSTGGNGDSGSGTGSTGGSGSGSVMCSCVAPNACTGKTDGTIFANAKTNGFILCECQCPLEGICDPSTVFNVTSKSCVYVNGGDSGTGSSHGSDSGCSGGCSGSEDSGSGSDSGSSNGSDSGCSGGCSSGSDSAAGNGDSGSSSGGSDHTGSSAGNGDSGTDSGSGGSTSSGNGGDSASGSSCATTGQCAGQPDGTMFSNPNTTGYIVCQFGCEVQMPCAPGTAFNVKLETCDFSSNN